MDRSFSAAGSGTVVTGTLTGGSLRVGDQLLVVPGNGRGRVRGLQAHGRSTEAVGPGRRVAVNLAGLQTDELGRGQAIVRAEQWEPTTRFDVELSVLASLDHPVARRGAFILHTGTYSGRAEVQLLGGRAEALPGESSSARLRLVDPLALMPGDRFVLRESGRDETVGGGEVLDVAPVLRPGKANPDRSIDRVIAERGWVDADLLRRLTGESRQPDVGRWVVDPQARQAAEAEVRSQVEAAGTAGLAVTDLSERSRALLATLGDLEVAGEQVRVVAARQLKTRRTWRSGCQR